jgi:hypothetical protein
MYLPPLYVASAELISRSSLWYDFIILSSISAEVISPKRADSVALAKKRLAVNRLLLKLNLVLIICLYR